MSSTDDDRCRALTEDGERCSRPAQGDGFCYQHDESDPTTDDEMNDGHSNDDSENAESASDEGTDGADANDEDSTDETGDGDEPEIAGSGIIEVRQSVRAIGRDLIGHELDGIIGIAPDGDGWQATVEVVERSAVPDTQDILGRYEIAFDADRSVSSYRRVGRYRRADTNPDDRPE